MKIIVCGGRNVGRTSPNAAHFHAAAEISRATDERNFVIQHLSKMHAETPITMVIAGDEGGAERIGLNWAVRNGIPVDVWTRKKSETVLSKSLGLLRETRSSRRETMTERNSRMLAGSKPDLVIAFGGGESTRELLEQAKRLSIPVLEVLPPGSNDNSD